MREVFYNRSLMDNCSVCYSPSAKYKCPNCVVRYCTVNCFKKHRATPCVKIEPEIANDTKLLQESSLMSSHEISSEESEDKVPDEKLQLLSKDDDVQRCLKNPHLRRMLSALDSTDDPQTEIERAMMEPIFVEFADCCLKVVQPTEQ